MLIPRNSDINELLLKLSNFMFIKAKGIPRDYISGQDSQPYT